ncbi:glycosyltransferase [Candidatus Falkowbacteria bacterium]|nr:glycosyltransferase [Candidatus Falkowbacteria bacterium]
MDNFQLSLIVPCYNEGPHLEKNLNRLKQVLDTAVYKYEIIIIDDASKDNTVEIADNFIAANNSADNIIFIKHQQNCGRGKTVCEGIMAAQGEIAGFVDIDFSTSPWYIPALAAEIKNGSDIVIGQRIYKLRFKVLHRWILSKGYKFLVKLFLGLDLGDTESGCKFFNRERIIPVLSQVKDERWFWDTEIIARAYLAGLKITQLPTVFIRESLYTTVKIFSDSGRHFINLLKLKKELKPALKK